MKIVTIDQKKEAKILRETMKHTPPEKIDPKLFRALAKDMRVIMNDAEGVGLSANQIGLDLRFFVAEVPSQEGGRGKLYAILNPEIVKSSKETSVLEEGCLSVPGVYGPVERPERITISGLDLKGKKIKIKAWGFLARVFQHEIDHLNGVIFIDRAKELHKAERISSNK
jgi:peptide deformylase